MKKRLIRIAPLLLLVAVVTLTVVVVAQANLHDVRIRIGVIDAKDPNLVVGGLYQVRENGHLRSGPPLCRPTREVRDRYFEENSGPVRIYNVLGQTIPIIGRVSTWVLAPIDPSIFASSRTELEIEGHTLVIDPIAHVKFIELSRIPAYIDELYEANPACETEVKKRYLNGRCVVIVHQTSSADGVMLGFGYNNGCLKADLGDDPASYEGLPDRAPKPRRRLAENISDFKDYVGLIDIDLRGGPQAAANLAEDR